MLQKLPLTISSRPLFSLNVSKKLYRCLAPTTSTSYPSPHFIHAYISHPPRLQSTSLIEVARSWSYDSHRKTNKWRLRDPKAIVHVLPCYYIIPAKDTPSYIDFCRVELLLYKSFRNISSDIGNSNEDFVAN